MHLLLLCLARPALAATWTVQVDGSGDFPTLAAAVIGAAPGDTLVLGEGSFVGGLDLGGKALSLVGAGADRTTIDGGGTTVLTVAGGVDLADLTLTSAGGRGLSVAGGTANLDGVHLSDLGDGSLDGGAIHVAAGAVVLVDSVLTGGQGGAGMIHLGAGTSLQATGSRFEESATTQGGAIYAEQATVVLDSCAFEELYAEGEGGAVYLQGGSLSAVDSTFYGNLTELGSGAAVHAHAAAVELQGGSFELNYSVDYDTGLSGGALYLDGSTLSARATVFQENWAYYGGAVRAYRSTVSLEAVEFDGNWAYYGGALFLDTGASLDDRGSTWGGNSAYYGGGALFAQSTYTVTVDGSTFEENVATYNYGGAVYLNSYGSSTWTDTAFLDNVTSYGGGAVMSAWTYGLDSFRSCTFQGNEATYAGGGALRAHYYSDLLVEDSAFDSNESTYEGGAVYLVYSAGAFRRASFRANRSTAQAGGALSSYYAPGNGGALVVEDSDFDSNEAAFHGGAISSTYDPVFVSGTTFHVNDAGPTGFGGAIFLSHSAGATIEDNDLAGNNAAYGGAVYDDLATGVNRYRNNRLVDNSAEVGAGMVLASAPGAVLTNNSFVGNTAVQQASGLGLVQSQATVVNNLFAHAAQGAALHAWDLDSAQASTFAWNAFYDLPGGVVGGELTAASLGEGTVLDLDPLLSAWTADGDPSDDSLVLLRDSPLLDAGDPTLLDPDGGPSDIGAWGGPQASVEDQDLDGWPAWQDCFDDQPLAFPGNVETWYDGVNGDCLSGSDFDADRDGVDAQGFGGTDCDDADPSVQEDCGDDTGTAGDGGGAGGDGGADGGSARPPLDGGTQGGGCGCASTGAPAAPWLAALVLGLVALGGRRRP